MTTTKTEHTPGPWHTVPVGLVEGRARVQIMASSRWIADAVATIRYASEAEANARLIAAAPDLLAALEAAYTVIRDAEAFQTATSAFEGHLEHAEGLAYAAIRKARGEE